MSESWYRAVANGSMVRILSVVLAVIFAASGIAKLLSLSFEVEAFTRWGYSLSFMYFTGALELAGAVGLMIPRLSALAAFCLAGLMVGAVATHVMHAEWPMLAVALIIATLAVWRGWVGRYEIRTLWGKEG